MQLFRDAIDECGFMDLGFMGSNSRRVNILGTTTQFGKDLIRDWPPTIGSLSSQVH